jgi:mRNA-degrading endonuclease toxin of MazEF toxin-antitoxin module
MRQGEIYWLSFAGDGSEPSLRRPAVIVQHDRYNRSALRITVFGAVSSNLGLAAIRVTSGCAKARPTSRERAS